MIACLVVEKGVEKIVEKSAESWWDYYYHQGGDKTPTTSPERPKLGAPHEQIRRLEQGGKRLPDLLSNLGYVKPGEITIHSKRDPTEGLEPCVLREGGCSASHVHEK
jgi:hypothetical protein